MGNNDDTRAEFLADFVAEFGADDDEIDMTKVTMDFDMMTKESMATILRYAESVEVTFTKKDKSVRVMNCTLHPSVLAQKLGEDWQPKEEEEPDERPEYEKTLSVWDLDKNAWRSFVVSSVLKIVYYAAETAATVTMKRGFYNDGK